MIPDPLAWLPEALDDLAARGLRRHLVVRRPLGEPLLERTGRSGPLVNFASNDYLGLAADPRLAEATARAAREFGSGAGASPVISGRTPLHDELERRLATLMQCEAALVFSSGFATSVGVIPALLDEGDAIFSDELNHASLIDGCRLARAERHIYRHNDVRHLEELLKLSTGARRKLIVTDSVFSMGGDIAPLVEIGALAECYGAMLLVDEAHAVGVRGANGAGVIEELAMGTPALARQVTIRMGTLSKALGAAGGFVAGSRLLIDWLANRARSYVFSTAPPPPVIAAVLSALDIVAEEPVRREVLAGHATWLRGALTEHGYDIGGSASQIVPVIVGTADRAMRLSEHLAEQGFWIPGIRPPTVPEGGSLVRISLRADHTREQLEAVMSALRAF